ncbi:hypothetical protein NQ317_014390 [Molorchus minor]|uniref:Uncharacterized protein n=1 Tax=Molorchus minor TaxID=1323400 RepID=A0ABQ9K6S7_9CUCU|nr:hypothetical protein NQ317_014390 [Molorchus minor]
MQNSKNQARIFYVEISAPRAFTLISTGLVATLWPVNNEATSRLIPSVFTLNRNGMGKQDRHERLIWLQDQIGKREKEKQVVIAGTRLNTGLTVLTEQSGRRGGSRDSPPSPSSPPRHLQTLPERYPPSKTPNMGGATVETLHRLPRRRIAAPSPGPRAVQPHVGKEGEEVWPSRGSSKEKSSKGVRGVPQSFGYVKRNGNGLNGTTNGAGNGQNVQVIQSQSGKTAAVSAVPRTKVKVSGGTQTCSSDLQQAHKSSPPQFKSYSLTGNAANQLSQSVRERLMMGSQSLPKGACHQDYGLVMRQVRPKASDGSLNTYSVAPRLSETDSMESLSSLPSHRSSLTHTRLLQDSPSRLSRSNSIRSTKSEKLYPSMLHRNTEPETEPYYCLPIGSLSHWSQPTSPAPGSARTFPLSPTHSSTPRHSMPKNDEVHGSSISLVSTASSLYSSAEEKQGHEIRKLRRELIEAQEKVHTLTSQLSTNKAYKHHKHRTTQACILDASNFITIIGWETSRRIEIDF